MTEDNRVRGPGLKYRKRRAGPPVPCWFADRKAIAAGYPVKYVNLSSLADRPDMLRVRAQRLQSEMLLWLSGKISKLQFDGTFRSVIRLYETDPESDYSKKLKPGVQRTYEVYIKKLIRHIGDLRIDRQDGRDLK